MIIGDVHRVAALMYLSCNKDTATRLGKLIDPAVWEHLQDGGYIHRPVGWPTSSFLVTTAGKRFLEAKLR